MQENGKNKKLNRLLIEQQIGEKFTQRYGGEIIAKMEMEVERFG